MKKRFGKISAKTGKKNGAAVFVCAVILAISLGTLAGCSVTPGSPAAAPAPSAARGPADAPSPAAVPGPSGAGNMQAENLQSESPLQGASDAALVAAAFIPGMGCSDPTCTDASHHHDCPAGCADYEHHHTCALDCTEAGHHHAESHHEAGAQNNADSFIPAFIPGMGCSDPTCTDASHHHDCPAGCADYEHHHTCALDCTEAGHHHATAAPNNSGSLGNSGNSNNSGNSGNSGNSSGHHNDSGHHSDRHHG